MEIFDIAKRLKELRLANNLTQEEFAEFANISYKFYQHLESGRKKLVRIDTIARIANAYNIELWEFFHPKLNCNKRIKSIKPINSNPHNRRHIS